MKRVFCLLVAILLIAGLSFGTNYYVKNGGDNGNTGQSDEQAWATVTFALANGWGADAVISLKCGSVFRETCTIPSGGTSGHYKTINSYDTGAKPQILASTQIAGGGSSWTFHSGINPAGIWQANLASTITELFFIAGDGAVTWGNAKKANHDACTAEYDWYSDGTNVWIYSPTDPNSRYANIEAQVRTTGIFGTGKNYITIDGVEIAYCQVKGIQVEGGASYWIVRNSTVHHSGDYRAGSQAQGIWMSGISHVLIEDDLIYEVTYQGILIRTATSYAVTDVIIQRTTCYNCFYTQIDLNCMSAQPMTDCYVRYCYCYYDSTALNDLSNIYGTHYYIQGNGTSNKASNIYFYYNIGYNNANCHLQVANYCDHIYIWNNTFYGYLSGRTQPCHGILISGGTQTTITNVEIKNNIAMNCGRTGQSEADLVINLASQISACDYNCWFNTTGTDPYVRYVGNNYTSTGFAAYKAASGLDTHSLWEDPKFIGF